MVNATLIMTEVIAVIIVEYFLIGALPSVSNSLQTFNWTVVSGTTTVSLSWIGFLGVMLLYLLLLGIPIGAFYLIYKQTANK